MPSVGKALMLTVYDVTRNTNITTETQRGLAIYKSYGWQTCV